MLSANVAMNTLHVAQKQANHWPPCTKKVCQKSQKNKSICSKNENTWQTYCKPFLSHFKIWFCSCDDKRKKSIQKQITNIEMTGNQILTRCTTKNKALVFFSVTCSLHHIVLGSGHSYFEHFWVLQKCVKEQLRILLNHSLKKNSAIRVLVKCKASTCILHQKRKETPASQRAKKNKSFISMRKKCKRIGPVVRYVDWRNKDVRPSDRTLFQTGTNSRIHHTHALESHETHKRPAPGAPRSHARHTLCSSKSHATLLHFSVVVWWRVACRGCCRWCGWTWRQIFHETRGLHTRNM